PYGGGVACEIRAQPRRVAAQRPHRRPHYVLGARRQPVKLILGVRPALALDAQRAHIVPAQLRCRRLRESGTCQPEENKAAPLARARGNVARDGAATVRERTW